MRNASLKVKFLMLSMLLFSAHILMSQVVDTTGVSDPVFPDGPTLAGMVKVYHLIYGAIVIIWGYVAKLFKFTSTPNKLIITIIVGGVVLGGVLVQFGFSSTLPLIFSFLSAIGVYNLFLKPFGLKVMRPEEKAQVAKDKTFKRG